MWIIIDFIEFVATPPGGRIPKLTLFDLAVWLAQCQLAEWIRAGISGMRATVYTMAVLIPALIVPLVFQLQLQYL